MIISCVNLLIVMLEGIDASGNPIKLKGTHITLAKKNELTGQDQIDWDASK